MADNRPDLSNYLAHFTKGRPGKPALRILEEILSSKRLLASNLPWTNLPAVCFTECPWTSLLAHSKQYSPFGIGFAKPRVFAAGGGPAYYVRADHYKKQNWKKHVHTFVTPFWPKYRPASLKTDALGGKTIDYSHEREWRVPHDFVFEYSHVEFVILNSYDDMAKFSKDLKDQIGREKFILMENYKTIEQLWPVHKV
ncbi:MAG: hypothetical protein KDA57_00530 [Planctomycetales bacterium]|nr:hypothetical protein [Planctomycetales bacterium]